MLNMFMGSSASVEMAKEPSPETDRITIATLLHGLTTIYQKLLNLTVGIEARRYQDGTGDPDYGRRLRELEGQIAEIDREQSGFRMGDYHEGGDKKTWKDYLLGIVALVIMAWLTRISIQMDNVIRVVVRQEVDEKQIAELRCTVYKICQ